MQLALFNSFDYLNKPIVRTQDLLLMADFSQYDESEGWGVLLSQIEAGDNNQDAHRKDENGDLLLHYVLRKDATQEVVGALLEANPQAASVKDTNGLLPLHLALEKRAAPEIAEALLQAYPEAASEKDNDGRLPLHLASETQAAPKVVGGSAACLSRCRCCGEQQWPNPPASGSGKAGAFGGG